MCGDQNQTLPHMILYVWLEIGNMVQNFMRFLECHLHVRVYGIVTEDTHLSYVLPIFVTQMNMCYVRLLQTTIFGAKGLSSNSRTRPLHANEARTLARNHPKR